MTHEKPDLTTIPADAYWPKGGAVDHSSLENQIVRAVDDADSSCLVDVQISRLDRILLRTLLSAAEWNLTDSPVMCDLWAGHTGEHVGHLGPSQDPHDGEGGELWGVWGDGPRFAVRGAPRCNHSQCDHPRDYFCYGCRLPRGHDGRHAGRE